MSVVSGSPRCLLFNFELESKAEATRELLFASFSNWKRKNEAQIMLIKEILYKTFFEKDHHRREETLNWNEAWEFKVAWVTSLWLNIRTLRVNTRSIRINSSIGEAKTAQSHSNIFKFLIKPTRNSPRNRKHVKASLIHYRLPFTASE